MAKYNSSNLTLTVGGHDITAYLLTIAAAKIIATIENAIHFGDVWDESIFAGVKKLDPIQLGGFFDDTATTGPDALLGSLQVGTTVTVVITWGGTKTTSFSAVISEYDRVAAVAKMTRFMATVTPTGAVTET